METKLVLENLQRYTKKLEEQYPNETAYWHLQKLRNEIERVKNIAYEPVLETVKCDCALSGSCVYEKMICDTKQECRHKM